eukprot:TRINITY_DN4888_c0_g1_i1.p1 TRINITY_DN4888_c0_g1~~TRINITY_DN4888_c0_g1_i1.p1  ORF type:complete len:412 (+),score=52.34 TRINITY_DN4888_c0_g1_i1:99-1238(+)
MADGDDGERIKHRRLFDEEENNSTDVVDNQSSSSWVSEFGHQWWFLFPIAVLLAFTTVATLIAQVGIFTGLAVTFHGGIVISPYSPQVTANISTKIELNVAKFVAPVVLPLLNSTTIPSQLVNNSSNGHDDPVVIPCQGNSQYYCPAYYRCSISNSTCSLTLKASTSRLHVGSCSLVLSSQDVVVDEQRVSITGVHLLHNSQYPRYVPLVIFLFGLCTAFVIFLLLQDINHYEADETEFGTRTFSLIGSFKKKLPSDYTSKGRLKFSLAFYAIDLLLIVVIFVYLPFTANFISVLNSLVDNECVVPSDLTYARELPTNPAQQTVVNTMLMLQTVGRYCACSNAIGLTYLLTLFYLTAFKRFCRTAIQQYELQSSSTSVQ